MNSKILLMALILLSFAIVPGIASAKDPSEERGKYIYDEAGRISLEAKLGLSAYLWKLDTKSGYETVVVFPKEKLTVEQMGDWFNKYGVGKEKKDNGLAIFVFPDNTVYGMIGRGHDRIATPYLTTFGERSLRGLDKEFVLAVLNFLNVLGKKIDEPTAFEKAEGIGKAVIVNFDIILLWLLLISLLILLYQQKDGFQTSDLTVPAIFFVLAVVVFGIMAIGSEFSSNTGREYGVITSTKMDSDTYTETHCSGSGKDRHCRTEWHTDYINDATIISYDFREYQHRFRTKDSKWAWQRTEGELLQLGVNVQNHGLSWADAPINDISGGLTDRYGTWIKTKKNKDSE